MSTPMALDHESWVADGLALIEGWAREGRRFTAEDVREKVGPPPTPNRMGALVMQAKRLGYIEVVAFVPATRRERHGAVNRIWGPNPETYRPEAMAA